MKISLVNGLLMVAFAVAISLSNADEADDAGPKNETTTVTTTTVTTEPATTSTTTKTTPTTSTTPTSTTASSTASSSTKPSPTPTPKPTPPPPAQPPRGIWNVTSNGYTCILFDAGIRMTFNYKNSSDQMVMDHHMDVPQNATASGSCEPEIQFLLLSFSETWKLAFYFQLDQNSKKYNVSSVELLYNEGIFPGAIDHTNHHESNNKTLFPTDAHKQYKCNTHQSVLSRNSNLTGVIDITTSSLQFEAFGNFTSHTFSSGVNHCSPDEVSQLVPIIVGAVLAGLIIIVLIAYLIGRRRSRRGYESV